MQLNRRLYAENQWQWYCSDTKSCPTLCYPMSSTTPLSPSVSQSLLKLMSLESVMLSNHLILGHPHLLLPSIFSRIRVFPSELDPHIRRPKYWSFSFSISPSKEYSGWISFRTDWYDLLAVQGTLKSLLLTTIKRNQFFGAHPSLWSNPYSSTWLLEMPQLWQYKSLSAKWCLCFLTYWLGVSRLLFQGASIF